MLQKRQAFQLQLYPERLMAWVELGRKPEIMYWKFANAWPMYSTLASGLTMRHTRTLGIVVPDITSPFHAQLMVLLTSEAQQYGYQVLLCNSFRDYETEMEYFKLLISNQVEGILFYPVEI